MNKLGQGLLQYAMKPVVKSITKGGRKLFSNKYLLYTNTGLTIGLSCVGDLVQQNYQMVNNRKAAWDKKRTIHVSCTGFAVGPFCHYWYMFLDKWLPGRTLKVVFRKILVDQLVCSPIFIGTFLITLCLFENASWEKTKTDLVDKGKTLYTADWIIWPPAQLINFLFLPTKYRVLYDNGIAFGFDCYFSYVRYDKDYEDKEKEDIDQSDNELRMLSQEDCGDSSFENVQSEIKPCCDMKIDSDASNHDDLEEFDRHIFS